MVVATCAGTFVLNFNNRVQESGNLSPTSTTSWTPEPFPTPGPNGVIAHATTAGVNGWVLDNSATLWRRVDQSTFTQITTGDLSPTFFDFYASQVVPPGLTVVGNIGAIGGQQSYVSSLDG